MVTRSKNTKGGSQASRGGIKHVQQTRVADAEGREEPFTRGKAQKVTEKKEARPNVKNLRMQKKKGGPKRGAR
jgi:hypothetical protein